jgi:cysteine-rich repeat protein
MTRRTHHGVLLLGSLLIAATCATSARGEVACPAGEITLDSALLRVVRRRAGEDRLVSPRNTFVVPEGDAIDPATEPIVYAVEADHQPLLTLTMGAARGRARLTAQPASGGRGSLSLRQLRGGYRLDVRLLDLDLAGLADPPLRVKQLLKIGDDCFSAMLSCSTTHGRLVCARERSALLKGTVGAGRRQPLAGAMLTVYDASRLESVSVFSQEDGRFVFPPLRPGSYRVRVRLVGYEDVVRDGVSLTEANPTKLDVLLAPASDESIRLHLPATHVFWEVLGKWPDPTIRGDFTLSCGNCHQIGAYRFRREKPAAEWNADITEMMTFLPPYFQATRDLIRPNLLGTYGPGTTLPTSPLPPPPAGETLRAVVYEYGLGDATARPGCHDLELGTDGVVYADSGVRWIDPRSGERGTYPIIGGAHSIERAPDGNMWITQAGEDILAKLDVHTGAFTYYPLPRIGEDQGSYPHTLRFDAQGRIWFTLTKSNHVAVFDPATEQFTYHRLPAADGAEVGLPIPVAYGCDVAPDQSVWFSQLFGERIGRFVPATGELKAWRPPFLGPRRLHAGRDGIVWVPGYASGVLGRFDPALERWKVYDLPTGLPGPPGFGNSETPYSLNANRLNGEVWVTGSNSDTLLRFEPPAERFTVFPLPTQSSFTREIEFDPDNNVWTCTSNEPAGPGEPGRGKFVKVELPPAGAICGNGRRENGEECDDGNANDCDRCTSQCTLVTGCGDGARCGGEACDDGNTDDCDGCSSSCQLETGLRCGDGVINAACGEVCDPPVPGLCSERCQPVASCGNGVVDPGEVCDDGNTDDCDACTTHCTLVNGCGDGVVCGGETCDDKNGVACDGCSPACTLEVGYRCGDGTVNGACGEECDPPTTDAPECNYLCRLGPAAPLGTRHLSFGGTLYSSALGLETRLGSLIGELDLVGDAPGPDGVASVTVAGPIFYRAPILGGTFGHFCVRISGCTGVVDCNGGTAADVDVVQDSAGPGKQGNPSTTTTRLGSDGGPGTVLLSCSQAVVQTAPEEADCTIASYPAEQATAYTTAAIEGHYLNGDPRIGTGRLALSGEPFVCADWSTENGPGKLAGIFLREDDPQAGDTANATLIDD